MQTLFGLGDGVAGVADQHIGPDAFRCFGDPCGEKPACGIHQRRPVVRCIEREKHLLGLNGEEQIDVPVLEADGFESPREFDAAHLLFPEHGEHGADVRLRAGQQVVVQNVAAGADRQFPQWPLAFGDAAEPAVVGAASRGDGVPGGEIPARHEVAARFSGGGSADSDRGHLRPCVGQELCLFHVPGECHGDMDFVYIMLFLARRGEKGEIICGTGFGFAGKHPRDSHVNNPPSGKSERLSVIHQSNMALPSVQRLTLSGFMAFWASCRRQNACRNALAYLG